VRSGALDVGGVQLAYQVIGAGPPVLLIHGTTGDGSAYWQDIAPALADAGHTVVTYDQRGFGRSGGGGRQLSVSVLAADAAKLLVGLDIVPATVVGVSLGGIVAQQLASDRPEFVAGLGLVATCPEVGPRLTLLAEVLGNAAVQDAGLLFDLNTLLAHGEKYLVEHKHELEAGRASFVASGRAWFGDALDEPMRWDGIDGPIDCPTLIVHGDEDVEMPLRYARELAVRFPRNTLHVMSGAGHKCPVERPAEFVATLVRFLRYWRGMTAQSKLAAHAHRGADKESHGQLT
jgi:3-oxoadipate enol-lactonase